MLGIGWASDLQPVVVVPRPVGAGDYRCVGRSGASCVVRIWLLKTRFRRFALVCGDDRFSRDSRHSVSAAAGTCEVTAAAGTFVTVSTFLPLVQTLPTILENACRTREYA